MKARILVTEPIDGEVLEYLAQHYTVDVGERGIYNTEENLIRDIDKYDALLSMLSNPVSHEVLQAGKNLKIVANYAVGYNNINIDTARDLGIKVSNTPDVLSEATADLAWLLILSVARKLDEAQKSLREGSFDGWHPLKYLGMELNGKILGIIGMGRIGQAVAKRASGFGMTVHYHNRNRLDTKTEQKHNATFEKELTALVSKADILSIHCPLTTETHHLIDSSMIRRMPDHAILINTARGPVVDEEALADALHKGTIGGAGLDVFEKEPEVHPRILNAPNCVVLPHIGSATVETRKKMGFITAKAIEAVLENRSDTISNLVV